MKKTLLALLIMVLCVCLMVCFTACGDDNTDNSTPSSENNNNNNNNQQVTTTVGEATNKALINLLTSNDVTIKLDMAVDVAGEDEISAEIGADLYIAKNDQGKYELKAVVDGDATNSQGNSTIDLVAVLVDGKLYTQMTEADFGEESETSKDIEEIEADLTAATLIQSLLDAYNSGIGTQIGLELKSKEEFGNLIAGLLNAATDSAVINKVGDNYEVNFSIDEKEAVNDMLAYVASAKDVTLDEFIVEILSSEGVELTKEQLSQAITNAFAAGLDFDGVIAKLEGFVKDITGETVSIKAAMDKAQATSKITTAQLVAIMNFVASQNVEPAEGEEAEPMFPAVEGNETFFDYIKRNFGAQVDCDALAQMIMGSEEATLADIGEMVKQTISTTKVGDIVGMIVSQELEDMDWDSEEEYMAAYESAVDSVFETIAGISFESLKVSYKLVLNADLKLISVDYSMDVSMKVGDVTSGIKAEIGLDVDYAEIPAGTIVAPFAETDVTPNEQ